MVSVQEGGAVNTEVIEPRLNPLMTSWSVMNVAEAVEDTFVFSAEKCLRKQGKVRGCAHQVRT
jgi:hypothetical protein